MSSSASANGLSIIHKGSKGKAICTIPDVCKIPGPNGAIPIPLMNKAESKDLSMGTITVKLDGQSVGVLGSTISKSVGDAVGVLGGIVSGSTRDMSIFFTWSPDVIFEMRPVLRKTDKCIMNKINTLCLPGWDQNDLENIEGKNWVKFRIIDDDGSDDPTQGVMGVKLKITLPDGTQEVESGPSGIVSFTGIESTGNCSVELNEEEGSKVLEITDRWPATNLATNDKHRIGVKVLRKMNVSG